MSVRYAQGRGDYNKRDNYARQVIFDGPAGPWIGKPATAFTEGALTAPNNVVNLWLGPAHGGSSAVDGTKTVEADYSTDDFATTDFVIVTRLSDGKKYVSCMPSGGA